MGIRADVSEGESRQDARGLVCFQSAGRHEIRVQGRKLIGSAQRRSGGMFLQHGSILTGPAHSELPRYLLPGTRGADTPPEQLAALTTGLARELGRDLTPKDLDEAADRLADAFAQVLGLSILPD